jgi:acid phosphatase type 7
MKYRASWLLFGGLSILLIFATRVHWLDRSPAGTQTNFISHIYLSWTGDETQTSTTVNFHTRDGGPSGIVYYDSEPRNGDLTKYRFKIEAKAIELTGTDRQVQHAKLQNLASGTTYYFVVSHPDVPPAEKSFRTLKGNTYRFVVGGDLGFNDDVKKLMKLATSKNPDFYVLGGDIAYADRERGFEDLAVWDEFLTHWEQMTVSPEGHSVPMFGAIGNHEIIKCHTYFFCKRPFFLDLFAQQTTAGPFVRRFGDHIVFYVLDTEAYVVSHESQALWLKEKMRENSGRRWQFAVYHRPLYTTVHKPDAHTFSLRSNWLPVFDEHHLTLAFEHHDHHLKRTKMLRGGQEVQTGGTIYIGDGGWGGSRERDEGQLDYLFKAKAAAHFWLVEVSEAKASFQAIGLNGEVLDSFDIPKPESR